MKKNLTKNYMTIFAISIALIISIWILLSYLFIFGGKDVNMNDPRYLVNSFEQYVDFDNGIHITNQGKAIIKENALWVQIIDDHGTVFESYNTTGSIPKKYTVFDIAKDSMYSNATNHQTTFISSFMEHRNLGVIIGCDSSKVTKYTIKITSDIKETILKSLFLLMIIFITVGILAGLIYSRNISRPILNIVDNIDSLEKDKELTIIDRKNIYSSVYESMKKLKNRLNAAKAEQAKNEKLREEWISNISHDMKTPLTTIKGYAEIMTDPEYEVSPEEQVEFSEIITRNVEVIEGLVKDLNLSRLLKAGKVNMVKEQIDICQLLKECCDNMNIKYKDQIQTNFEHEKILIHADQNYLRRVFLNIICNAFIHNRDDVQVLICCYEKKNNAIIEISDNGKGMSQEDLENIFSRYYRGRASTEIDGSGLGMAIAYEIVKAHQGKIEIKSTQGQGTTFCIYLRK